MGGVCLLNDNTNNPDGVEWVVGNRKGHVLGCEHCVPQ